MKRIIGLLILLGAFVATLHADVEADAIMKKALGTSETKDMSGLVYMVLRETNGTKTTRTLSMYTKKTENGTNSYIEFLSPADVKGTRFLTIGNNSSPDDQRLWLPELGKVRKIASSGKDGKFMGSDLTYYDMEDRAFGDSVYQKAGEGSVTVTKDSVKKERNCRIIKTVPKDPEAPYSYLLMWVGTEDNYIYKSEMYDKKGVKEKTMYIVEVNTINGKMIPLKTLITDSKGHQTLMYMEDLKIDTGLDDGIFTVRYLER